MYSARRWTSVVVLCFVLGCRAANIVIDDSDPSIIYTPAVEWGHDTGVTEPVVYNGTFSFAGLQGNRSDPTTPLARASVSYTFSEPGTAFYWYGLQRSDAGLFSICIDCQTPEELQNNFTVVDAYNSSSSGNDPTVVLYGTANLSYAIHTVVLGNLLDPRVGMYGQMTVDAFVIIVPNTSSTSTVMSAAAGASASATPQNSSLASSIMSSTSSAGSNTSITALSSTSSPSSSTALPSIVSSTATHSTTITPSAGSTASSPSTSPPPPTSGATTSSHLVSTQTSLGVLVMSLMSLILACIL